MRSDSSVHRQRVLVIRFRQAGLTMKEIADRPEVSVCADTVSRWCRKYTVAGMGGLLATKTARGKPKRTSLEEDQTLLEIVKEHPYVPLSIILDRYYPEYSASLMTAYRTLTRLGYVKKKRPNEIRSIRVRKPKGGPDLSFVQRPAENRIEIPRPRKSTSAAESWIEVARPRESTPDRSNAIPTSREALKRLATGYVKTRHTNKTRSLQSTRSDERLDIRPVLGSLNSTDDRTITRRVQAGDRSINLEDCCTSGEVGDFPRHVDQTSLLLNDSRISSESEATSGCSTLLKGVMQQVTYSLCSSVCNTAKKFCFYMTAREI